MVNNHNTKVWRQAMFLTNPFRIDTMLEFETEEDFVTEETWDHISDINTVAKKDMGDSLIDMIMKVTMDHHN